MSLPNIFNVTIGCGGGMQGQPGQGAYGVICNSGFVCFELYRRGAMSQETSNTSEQAPATNAGGTLYQPTPSTTQRPATAAPAATPAPATSAAASNAQPTLNTIQANLSNLLKTPASATHSAQIAAALAPHMTQIMNLAKQGTLTESQMAQVSERDNQNGLSLHYISHSLRLWRGL